MHDVGGEDNRPAPLPPPGHEFAIVLWLDGHGWTTVAWTLTRGSADEIAEVFMARPHYARSEVWFEGRCVAASTRSATAAGNPDHLPHL